MKSFKTLRGINTNESKTFSKSISVSIDFSDAGKTSEKLGKYDCGTRWSKQFFYFFKNEWINISFSKKGKPGRTDKIEIVSLFLQSSSSIEKRRIDRPISWNHSLDKNTINLLLWWTTVPFSYLYPKKEFWKLFSTSFAKTFQRRRAHLLTDSSGIISHSDVDVGRPAQPGVCFHLNLTHVNLQSIYAIASIRSLPISNYWPNTISSPRWCFYSK